MTDPVEIVLWVLMIVLTWALYEDLKAQSRLKKLLDEFEQIAAKYRGDIGHD